MQGGGVGTKEPCHSLTPVDRGWRWPDDERDARPPRPGEVLVKLGVVLLAHAMAILVVVWTTHSFATR